MNLLLNCSLSCGKIGLMMAKSSECFQALLNLDLFMAFSLLLTFLPQHFRAMSFNDGAKCISQWIESEFDEGLKSATRRRTGISPTPCPGTG